MMMRMSPDKGGHNYNGILEKVYRTSIGKEFPAVKDVFF